MKASILSVLAVVFFAFRACCLGIEKTVPETHMTLTVFYSNDLMGALTHCACKSAPLGGVARRATVYTQETVHTDFVLMVDAGGFSRGSDRSSQLQNDYLIKALNLMKYNAVNAGYKELMFKTDEIRKMGQQLELLSANVFLTGASKSFLKPFLIQEIVARSTTAKPLFKKVKVAVIGLSDEKLSPGLQMRSDEQKLAYRDPVLTAQQLVPELRRKADIVILLYYGKYDEMKRVLQAMPGIDVAVLGGEYYMVKDDSSNQKPITVASTAQGKYASILSLQLDKNKRITGSSRKQIALGPEIADDERMARLLDDFENAKNHLTLSGK